jgi:MSHA biogenesis protein MshM
LYLQHFGLRELPFTLTPDTGFTFAHAGHQAALNTVMLALQNGEGFVKVTGEVGTGKTLLCRRLLRALKDSCATAYLPNPNLNPAALYRALGEELGVPEIGGGDAYQLHKAFNAALLEIARDGRSVVLLVDEAQAMPAETLEALRLLSNLETEKRKLLQIVLLGQPELDERLKRPETRQLLQRIAFHYRLHGLAADEVAHYLDHRLRVAGHQGEPVFSRPAARAVHQASQGTPRLVNILAHKAMLSAFGRGEHRVGRRHIVWAARDTEGARRLGWLL